MSRNRVPGAASVTASSSPGPSSTSWAGRARRRLAPKAASPSSRWVKPWNPGGTGVVACPPVGSSTSRIRIPAASTTSTASRPVVWTSVVMATTPVDKRRLPSDPFRPPAQCGDRPPYSPGSGGLVGEPVVGGAQAVADQRAEQVPGPHQQPDGQDQVYHGQDDQLGGAGDERGQRELDQEQPRQGAGLPDADGQVDQDGDGEQALGGGQQQLLALGRPDGQAGGGAGGDREDQRQGADQQRPLVHLGGDQRAQAVGGVQMPGVQPGHQQLGRLRGQRRDPLDQEEGADPELLTGLDQAVGERLGRQQDDHGREPEERQVGRPPPARRQGGQPRRRADQVRRLRRGLGDPQGVGDEDGHQYHRVDQGDRALQGQGQRVQG